MILALASLCAVAFITALGYVCNEVRVTVCVIRGESVAPLGIIVRRLFKKPSFRPHRMGSR